MEKAIIISLLCKIANMNCDATTLIQGAACLECGIPPGMQDAVTNYLLCQIANGAGSGGTTQSAVYPLTDGSPLNVNFAHGLSITPSFVRTVLLCTQNDSSSSLIVGDEIDIYAILDWNNPTIPFTQFSSPTTTFLDYNGKAGANCIAIIGGVSKAFSSFNNFSMKVYYHA